MKLKDLYDGDNEVVWFECSDTITDTEITSEWRIRTRSKKK
jgi:hypothetical protein